MTVWSAIKSGWLYGIGKFEPKRAFLAYQQKMMTSFAWGVVQKIDKKNIFLKKFSMSSQSLRKSSNLKEGNRFNWSFSQEFVRIMQLEVIFLEKMLIMIMLRAMSVSVHVNHDDENDAQ